METIKNEGTPRPVILAVSFGTSYNESREKTIGAIEKTMANAYPGYEIRRAFTSRTIRNILKKRDGLVIDSVTEAMDRLAADGVQEVIVQPTHVMKGFEYDDVIAALAPYGEKFKSLKAGAPLLSEKGDYQALAHILKEETKAYDDGNTAVVFMGHGTLHDANAVYRKLQEAFFQAGLKNYFVGTVEAAPTVEDVLRQVRKSGAGRVLLMPLMVVSGDHANNDLAGDGEDSWKMIFKKAGFEVECVLKGLGEYEGVRKLYGARVAAAEPVS